MIKRGVFIACIAMILTACAANGQRLGDKLRDTAMNQAIEFANSTRNYLLNNSEESAIQLAKESVQLGLKDPESAQFRNVRLVGYNGSKVICGEVNAKNSYGGYVGHKKFIASPSGAKVESYGNKYAEFDRIDNIGLVDACG